MLRHGFVTAPSRFRRSFVSASSRLRHGFVAASSRLRCGFSALHAGASLRQNAGASLRQNAHGSNVSTPRRENIVGNVEETINGRHLNKPVFCLSVGRCLFLYCFPTYFNHLTLNCCCRARSSANWPRCVCHSTFSKIKPQKQMAPKEPPGPPRTPQEVPRSPQDPPRTSQGTSEDPG